MPRAYCRSTGDLESEPGISCLAIPVFLGSLATPGGAISISAKTCRTPRTTLADDLPAILDIVEQRAEQVAL